MKLGFSIENPAFIQDRQDLLAMHKDLESFLVALKSRGIHSIELRKLTRYVDEQSYQAYNSSIQMIWDLGLEITVHGDVAGDYTGKHFAEVYPSMGYILENFSKYQSKLVMALHAYQEKEGGSEELKKRTISLLNDWTRMVDTENIPLYFALENNRKKATSVDPGNSCVGVVEMVQAVNHPHLGITWDMGHFLSNLREDESSEATSGTGSGRIPLRSFLEKVYHTHIHGLNTAGRTHFPLTDQESLPLETYVTALQNVNYDGVYNLELSFDRFAEQMPVADSVFASIDRLKGVLKNHINIL